MIVDVVDRGMISGEHSAMSFAAQPAKTAAMFHLECVASVRSHICHGFLFGPVKGPPRCRLRPIDLVPRRRGCDCPGLHGLSIQNLAELIKPAE
jgi:hypothetical protein